MKQKARRMYKILGVVCLLWMPAAVANAINNTILNGLAMIIGMITLSMVTALAISIFWKDEIENKKETMQSDETSE